MQNVVDHLCALIRIPSVSCQSNRPVIEYAKRVLSQAHWQWRELRYQDSSGAEKVNLIAAPSNQDLEEKDVPLAFVCHTDTVPHAASWNNALEPYEADGYVYGCGACDVKGFLACLLTAAERAASTSVHEGVRIILTADEEIGCVGAARLISDDVIRPRQILVGEPTSLHAARAGKGYALAEFTIHGQEAHSALPANGMSAIYGAARLIAAIEAYATDLASEENAIFSPPFTTVNVGIIEGGTAKNIIAGSCRFLLEWRSIPNQNPAKVFYEVEALAQQIKMTHPGFLYSAKLLRQQLGFETAANSSLVDRFARVTGKSPTSIAFGSEASLFAAITDELIVFGPGDMQTAHSERECVPVAELKMAVDCIDKFMTQPR